MVPGNLWKKFWWQYDMNRTLTKILAYSEKRVMIVNPFTRITIIRNEFTIAPGTFSFPTWKIVESYDIRQNSTYPPHDYRQIFSAAERII